MANTVYVNVSQFTEITSLPANSWVYVVDSSSGSNLPRKIKSTNIYGNVRLAATVSNTLSVSGNVSGLSYVIANNLMIANRTTPANSTATVPANTMWFDSDYLYVATANNVIKRVPLTAF